MEVMSISCGGYHNGYAAGLPPGVINFLPGKASQVGDPVLGHRGFRVWARIPLGST